MSPIIMPVGATVTLSAARVDGDQDGESRLQITITDGSVQTWPDWLAIACARLEEANGARKRMTAAMAEGASETPGGALVAEYRACLQAISSAVFALDAFYGVIDGMIPILETEKAPRKRRRCRAASVADAIIRASARMPNDVRKTVKANIHAAYKLRDHAVHPPHLQEPFAVHPELNAQVPQRYIDYRLETSRMLVSSVVEAMTWVVDHPQPRNQALTAWAPIARRMLHEIADRLPDASQVLP